MRSERLDVKSMNQENMLEFFGPLETFHVSPFTFHGAPA